MIPFRMLIRQVFNPADESDAVLANAGAEIEENHLDPAAKLMRFTEVELAGAEGDSGIRSRGVSAGEHCC